MGHRLKLGATLLVGICALVLTFAFNLPDVTRLLVTVAGGLLALSMVWEMVQTLKSGRYGIDLLAIMAIVATLVVGEYWASLMILVMLTGGDALEDYATRKAGQELKSLLDNSPQLAHKQTAAGLTDIVASAVAVGDTLVVKPNELVPVDGEIIAGEANFDESSLTGEARPVFKQVGDKLLSGSVNGSGAITMTARHTAADSQYQALVKLVATAQDQPAKFVRMADRYAVPFTIIAIVIAAFAWVISGNPVRFAEVLVVASPCPLILAAPIALVAGMSRASRSGIVIKAGAVVEKMALAKTVAFDKTGTLTQGKLLVSKVVPIGGFTAEQLCLLAASVEQQSTHVLARSLVAYVGADQLKTATEVQEQPAQGVQAMIGAQLVKVGKASFAQVPAAMPLPDQTAIYVSVAGAYAGYITFADQLRPEAETTLERLRHQGLKHLMMLTGDQSAVAKAVGHQLDLDEIHGNCLPEDKINLIKATPKAYHPVIMVGDGINDAPSLAAADVGIAMGAHGATAASESADVVILKDDLEKVATAIQISQETMKIAKQDVIVGIIILVILMLIATTGVIPALVGAICQEVVDVITILLALKARKGHWFTPKTKLPLKNSVRPE
ncbi:MAG: cadmium-translocating P-type ATPase [Lactobacillus sp.]|jgi:heavy metal translocating P-type ATPase|nr:cadmium-translocating P-type ATPase [Lactobacillus sp.]